MYQINNFTRDGMQVWGLQDIATDTKAEVIPQRGALLTSLCVKGAETIYYDRENLCSDERPRCGMPVLFPCCGRNTNNTVMLEGAEYTMPIHGFAHTSAWQVAGSGTSETEAWLLLELTNNDQSDTMYPYRFKLQLRFSLRSGTLTVNHRCSNLDSRPMPFDFGYHPYFAMSGLASAEFVLPGQDKSLQLEGGKPETGHFILNPVGGVQYMDHNRSTSIEFDFSDNFNGLVFWSVPAKHFVCVEPWQGVPDGLNNGTSMVLQSGQSAEGFFSITPKLSTEQKQ